MKKEIQNGIIATVSLILFYFVVMTVASASLSETLEQFRQLWYWMIALSLGFGIQVGLYTNLKTQISKLKTTTQNLKLIKSGETITATSTGTSSASMIACCAHHLTEVLPIIGLSGFTIFLTRYQIPIIVFGITMNLLGILYMLKQIKKIKNKFSL